jgi:hypothetical protein
VAAGTAYVFASTASVWGQIAKVTADRNPVPNEQFARVVAAGGDYMVVGKPFAHGPDVWLAGAAQVFRRDDGGTPADARDDTWVAAMIW